MADTKITGLTADTAPTSSDLLVTVDVSDTTMDAAGTDKKVTVSNLSKAINLDNVPEGSTNKLLTASERTTISNQSGTNTGDQDVVDDTTPQLGGDLDVNGHKLTGDVSVAGSMLYNSDGQTFSTASKTLVNCTATNTLSYANTVVRVFANTGTYNATATQIIGTFFVVDTTGSVIKNDPSLTGYLPITYLFNSGGTYQGDTNATNALVIRDFVGNSTFNTINSGTLGVGEYTAFLSQGKVETGATITTYRAFWATNLPTVNGTITNQIGIDIDAITKATTLAVGLRIGRPSGASSNQALQLSGTSTDRQGGIQFGNIGDTTSLYRSASGTLKTDGNLVVGTAGTATGSAVTIDGTQTLTSKTLTSPVINTGVSGTAVLDEDNMASDSATKLATQQSIKAYVDSAITTAKSALYPVGSYYINETDSTNPGTLLGFGTWVAVENRTIVGKGSGTFATAGSTGGAETHTLTTSEIPSHSHTITGISLDGGSGSGSLALQSDSNLVWYRGNGTNWNSGGGAGGSKQGMTVSSIATSSSATAGTGGAHNNLQPYIVAYIWKRSA